MGIPGLLDGGKSFPTYSRTSDSHLKRWLFIVNAIITVFWGFFGIFMIPDLPNRPNPRAFWFNSADADLSMERLRRHNRAEPKKMTWAGTKRTFSSWPVYFIPVLYIACVLGSYGQNYFGLFLKSLTNPDGTKRWTTSQVNVSQHLQSIIS